MKHLKTKALLLATITVFAGCGMRTVRTPAQMIQARAPEPKQQSTVLTASPTINPPQRRPLTAAPQSAAPASMTEIISAARVAATDGPTPAGFLNAVQVYDYEPGRVYEVITTPGFVSVIRLRPGERLLDAAAGDTARWLVDTIESGVSDEASNATNSTGESAATRTSLLIKPRRPLIRTNLVITTSERTYLVDLRSAESDAYHSAVEWTYPATALRLPDMAGAAPPPRIAATRRVYAYLVKSARKRPPVWAPTAVYAEGHQVIVEFDPAALGGPRPPLFVLGPDDEVEIVNYRAIDNRYIVDRQFDRAELRLGSERVRIEHVRVAHDGFFGRVFAAIKGD